jgi:hypothetical protein
MVTTALGWRLALAFLLAIGLAGCGGDDSGTGASPRGISAQETAAAASTSLAASSASSSSKIVRLQRYQIDPTKVFVAGISSGGFAAVQITWRILRPLKGPLFTLAGCIGARVSEER